MKTALKRFVKSVPKPDDLLDLLVTRGSAVKAVNPDANDGKVSGWLVVFSKADKPDLDNQYFTDQTDYDLDRSTKASCYYHHAMNKTIKKVKIGEGDMQIKKGVKADDGTEIDGVWIDAQLNMRSKYARAVYKLAQKDALGWSSGTAPHLVDTKTVGKGIEEIIKWPLGLDATLTPTPCEPSAYAYSLKSLLTDDAIKSANDLIDEAIKSTTDLADDEPIPDGTKSTEDATTLDQPARAMTIADGIIAKTLGQFNTICNSLAQMGCFDITEMVDVAEPFVKDLVGLKSILLKQGGDAVMTDWQVDTLYWKGRMYFPDTVGALIPAATLQAFNVAADFALTRAYINLDQRRAIGKSFDKIIDNLSTTLTSNVGTRKLADYQADWKISLKTALATKSVASTASALLQAKIHQSFTVAADELAIRGYIPTDDRIKLSGLIGDLLKTFAKGIDPDVAKIAISAEDVDAIAAKFFDEENETGDEGRPRAGRTLDTQTKTLQAEVLDFADRLEDLNSDRERGLGAKALGCVDDALTSLKAAIERLEKLKTPSSKSDAMKELKNTLLMSGLRNVSSRRVVVESQPAIPN